MATHPEAGAPLAPDCDFAFREDDAINANRLWKVVHLLVSNTVCPGNATEMSLRSQLTVSVHKGK